MINSKRSGCGAASVGKILAYARRSEERGSELVLYDRTRAFAQILWSSVAEGEAGASIDDIAISADGRLVGFVCGAGESAAAGLTINAYADLYLYDALTGRRSRFGSGGELDPILGSVPMIREVALSANGQEIAFIAEKARGFPGQADVFVYDRDSERLSQANPVEISPCRNVAISGDGSAVFFTDALKRLHVHDRATERTRALPITLGQSGGAAHYAVSDDGRFISFTSVAFGAQGEVRLFDRRTGAVETSPERGRDQRVTLSTVPGRNAASVDQADRIPGHSVAKAAHAFV